MWKPIKDFEGIYEVSDDGRVRRIALKPSRFHMKEQVQFPLPNGYWTVRLRKPGEKRLNCYVHRLVAEAFIANPSGLPEVNHDNGNKDVNADWNLYWTDRSGNNFHKTRTIYTHHNQVNWCMRFPNGKTVIVKNLKEFCDEHNLHYGAMHNTSTGERNHHHGFSATRL
jgi:hypothetical protein